MIPIRPLPAAGLLVLLLGLSGCGYNYSLEERIAALRASGYNVEPREPNKRHAQRRKRAKPRTASEDHTLHTGSVSSRIETWKPVPADHKRTPYTNSPEWVREQAEAAEKDGALDRNIRSICRTC
jgi:hypothetical protein